ncbi:Fic family protein, partial [Flavihumibacter sediminis]|nr:Fic family protein [Flavihumibacter sediminis]
ENKLNPANFLQTHRLVSAHLLPENQRASIRKTEMLVMEHATGRIQYEAAPLTIVKEQYGTLWDEIEQLLQLELTIEDLFYYAAFIHLVFVNIHPFSDG